MKETLLKIFLVLCGSVGFYVLVISIDEYSRQTNKTPTPNGIHQPELSNSLARFVLNPENVYAEIMRNDILFADIVLRQAILETGWFTSYNCRKRNNLFGMTGGEKTSDNEHGYVIYKNWMQSVKAYKEWQQQRMSDSVSDYYQFLDDWNYAESDQYERKLKSINLIIIKN